MNQKIKYIDLFAGIGGFRWAFDKAGYQCVWTCEINPFAQKTYLANFPKSHMHGDIRTAKEIPDHDILLGGFPCQPFSLAGVSSKNFWGQKHGFECEKQGNMFFEVARIIKEKSPKAFILENVKNLASHDKGKTFTIIQNVLKDLGYHIQYKIINAEGWVPQKRQRVFIVGFKELNNFSLDLIKTPEKSVIKKPILKDILHDFTDHADISNLYLSPKLWAYLQRHAEKHREKGNGFGFGLHDETMVARTLSARYYKDGSEVLIQLAGYPNPRKLSPRECARLMGYPDDFKIVASNTQAYKQFGNSVVMPLIYDLAKAIKPFIK